MFHRLFQKVFCADGTPTRPAIGTQEGAGEKGKDTAGTHGLSLSSILGPPRQVGTLEDLHKKCKEVFPATFEGGKVMINKGLSNHFQVSHTITLSGDPGKTGVSGYRFGATFVGTKQMSPTEMYPVLLGDIDPAGNLNANVIHQLTDRIRGKFAAQIQDSQVSAAQMSAEYHGHDFTASIITANPNLVNGSGILIGHYLQGITDNISLGSEIVYQFGPAVPGGENAMISLAGRYIRGDTTWTGTVDFAGVHLCYHSRASEQLQLAVEVETNFRMQDSVATFGYQVDLPKANLVFKGMVDTHGTVAGVLEKKLEPLPFTLALSGALNHSKNQFRMGCGIVLG
uniref:Putative translocase of outer mitochondrial membrane complex subunit tom40 n=1 Tax=Nyssomyia neivai TaxID=330878 RepID=A0A1L8DVF3_9DIPT